MQDLEEKRLQREQQEAQLTKRMEEAKISEQV